MERMGKYHVAKLSALIIIPYVSLLFIYVCYYIAFIGKTSDIITSNSGQLIYWTENISNLLFGVLASLWIIFISNIPKEWKRGISVFQTICFLGLLATMYTTIFNEQMYIFIVNNRGYFLTWIGIYIVCLIQSFLTVHVKNQ